MYMARASSGERPAERARRARSASLGSSTHAMSAAPGATGTPKCRADRTTCLAVARRTPSCRRRSTGSPCCAKQAPRHASSPAVQLCAKLRGEDIEGPKYPAAGLHDVGRRDDGVVHLHLERHGEPRWRAARRLKMPAMTTCTQLTASLRGLGRRARPAGRPTSWLTRGSTRHALTEGSARTGATRVSQLRGGSSP